MFTPFRLMSFVFVYDHDISVLTMVNSDKVITMLVTDEIIDTIY